jgi:hypothetical protein
MLRRDLWLLPAGRGTARAAFAFLQGVAESRLLNACRSVFSWTLVDLPPLCTVGVAAVIDQVDGCVLVGRHRGSRIDQLAAAARMLPRAPLGFVMSATDPPRSRADRRRSVLIGPDELPSTRR